MRGKSDLRTVALNDRGNLEQHILFHRMVINPGAGLCKGVEKDIQRLWAKAAEIHDQGLRGVDFQMLLQHDFNVGHDDLHHANIGIANADGFLDAAQCPLVIAPYAS